MVNAIEKLTIALQNKTYEEKREVYAEYLCQIWTTIDDFQVLKDSIDIFTESLKEDGV